MKRLAVVILVCLTACGPARPPPSREVVHLRGTPYERGLQHGQLLGSKVHSLYTTLLTNSLFPYLSREQPDIASLLEEYGAERYQNGHFAYEMLLDSAHNVERTLPRAVREELQGVSDGSGLPYEQVLVLNTFVDSLLSSRAVAFAIRLGRTPLLESVSFPGADSDGVDNDGDGQIDEPGEGELSPFVPVLAAPLVELSPATRIRLVLSDPAGVNPATLRLLLAGTLYGEGDPALELVALSPERLEVTLTPSAPLAAASLQTLVITAGNNTIAEVPPPTHPRLMRDEEIVFTVRGAGLAPNDVRRPALTDGRTRPPSFALGLRGSATSDGQPLLAQHFSLLDANTSHRHGVVFVHHPDNGPAFAVVGWAGIVHGFSGMSARGVGYACNSADTLDNSVVGSVRDQVLDLSKAKLLAAGTPIGFLGRRVLENATDVASAQRIFEAAKHVYGWSCVLGDAQGGLKAVEVDSDIFKEGSNGVYPFAPEDLDASGRRYASVRDDDLELGSSFARNVNDITPLTLAGQRVVPERQWSTFFYRSRRVADGAARRVEAQYGQLDVRAVEALLGEKELVDQSDSMNAVVLELAAGKVHAAMGAEPATAAPFETVDLQEAAP